MDGLAWSTAHLKITALGLASLLLLASCGSSSTDVPVIRSDSGMPNTGTDAPADDRPTPTDVVAVTDLGAANDDSGMSDIGFDLGTEDAATDVLVDDASNDASMVVSVVDSGVDVGVVDSGVDVGVIDSGVDTGAVDTGVHDTGVDTGPMDSGVAVMDATVHDTGVDTGVHDTGVDTGVDTGIDTGVHDTGVDTGVHDTGVDTGIDAGVHDTGVDAGVHDTGVDTGVHDTGVDTGVHDTGVDIVVAMDTGMDSGGLPGPDNIAYTGTFPTTVGETDTSLTTAVEGVAREVDVYVPATHVANPPLLMCFHGTGGSGPEMFTDSEAQVVADTYGVIVVCPSSNWISTGDFDHPTAETYWLTYPQDDPDTNVDVLLVRACIEEAIRVYNIDQNRVYFMGHSSGSFFTLMLSQILSDRVAAFASNSGGLVECATTQSCDFMTSQPTCAGLAGSPGWCNCTGVEKPVTLATTGRHPPGWLGHGTNDPLVSVQYTCTLQAAMQALGMTVETQLRVGDGHDMPDNYASLVWPFLSTYVRN